MQSTARFEIVAPRSGNAAFVVFVGHSDSLNRYEILLVDSEINLHLSFTVKDSELNVVLRAESGDTLAKKLLKDIGEGAQ